MGMAVFTYGSLMFAPVWEKVVRGRYRSEAGVAHGFARFEVRDETYPGMIAAPGGAVSGVVYFDVDAADAAALDAFEGEAYRREQIEVVLASGVAMPAHAYLFLDRSLLGPRPWLPEEFRLQRFLDTYCRARISQ